MHHDKDKKKSTRNKEIKPENERVRKALDNTNPNQPQDMGKLFEDIYNILLSIDVNEYLRKRYNVNNPPMNNGDYASYYMEKLLGSRFRLGIKKIRPSYSEEKTINDFRVKCESENMIFMILIVGFSESTKSINTEWSIAAGFDYKGDYNKELINDGEDELVKELDSKRFDKNTVIKLARTCLGFNDGFNDALEIERVFDKFLCRDDTIKQYIYIRYFYNSIDVYRKYYKNKNLQSRKVEDKEITLEEEIFNRFKEVGQQNWECPTYPT